VRPQLPFADDGSDVVIEHRSAELVELAGDDASDLLAEADRLREDRRYDEAAEVYDRYLSRHPGDFQIWVERGNCLRESGSLAEARFVYERAIGLRPDDANAHLQMGHLMKLDGFRDEAIRHYREAMKLDPANDAAELELHDLGVKPKGGARLDSYRQGRPVRILDISDLLTFLEGNTRVSGIQRVQAAVVEQIFAQEDSAASVIVGYYDQLDRAIYALSPTRVLELIGSIGSAKVTLSEVRKRLRSVFASRRRITPRASDSFLILGAYWIGDEYPTILQQLKNAGTVIGVLVCDLIPITHPQHVPDATRRAVADKFVDVMQLADFALTISEFVAKEVAAVLSSELNRNIPVLAVPLSHELPEIRDADTADQAFTESLPDEYVLCVCTLEGRKNHLLLLNAWRALNRKYGRLSHLVPGTRGVRLPHLILVGKWGWEVEDFRSQLQALRNVNGKVVVLGSVSDGQLKYLYEHCLFTVFPSFAEGWGLPIGESLAYGKPCIASNATAMPEVGGDFCRYIDPYDPIGATAEIERGFVDRADLDAWTDRIAREFKVRTWAEVVQDLTAKAEKAEALARQSPWRAAVTLEGGQFYRLTRDGIYGTNTISATQRAAGLVCSAGWRPFEHWGAWSYRRTAKVEFGAPLPPGTKVRVFMQLRLPPPTMTDSINIRDANQLSKAVAFSGPAPVWTRVETETDARGMVRLHLERMGRVSHLEPARELYFGISAVAFYAVDDLSQRVRLVEGVYMAERGSPVSTASPSFPAYAVAGTGGLQSRRVRLLEQQGEPER
jgi:glycosyltransferase involved in cell wall biosynthesis